MARSLGPVMVGAVPPSPATNDVNTAAWGIMKRVGRFTPIPKPALMRELRVCVWSWLRENVQPLSDDDDLSVTTWLKHSKYSQARKNELLACAKPEEEITQADYRNKWFGKHEFLEDWKHMRVINSRSDAFKVLTGPYFHAIEQVLFRRENFVKFVPVHERLQHVLATLSNTGMRYAVTDWSSFEAHVTPEIFKIVEYQLYKFMLQKRRDGKRILKHILKALAGTNVCESKLGGYSIKGTRMSGDMCTSLGNAFTNMMMVYAMFHHYGVPVKGVFEGDDGVLAFPARYPSVTEKEFELIGAELKIKFVDSLEKAEFCGMFCADSRGDNLGDPYYVLSTFGWTMSSAMDGGPKVMKQLLRAKSISLAYELPCCPILRELADYGMRVTKGEVPRFQTNRFGELGWWDSQLLETGLKRPPPERKISAASRALFAEKFGISIMLQEKYEKYFRSKNDLDPIPNMGLVFPVAYQQNWALFTRELASGVASHVGRWSYK